MLNFLSQKEYEKLAGDNRAVVVYREIPGDRITPTGAFRSLGGQAKGAALLESGLVGHLGRYSFLHFNPVFEVRAENRKLTINERGETRTVEGVPFDLLRKLQTDRAPVSSHFLSRYTGGLIGYMGYDSVRLFENIPDRHLQKDSPAEIVFRSYQDTVAFDHQTGKAVVSTLVQAGGNHDKSYNDAMTRIDAIVGSLMDTPARNGNDRISNQAVKLDIQETMDDQAFKEIVDKAKRYIRAGDVFQVVLSRTFEVPFTAEPFDVYRALSLISPSPFMFYLDLGDQVIIGASPEKLVSLEAGVLESCPLAGTRPRGEGGHDLALETELFNDHKERAEHMMLVDLARNDLGVISKPGSVKVNELMKIKRFSHVMHISSTVTGSLEQGRDAFDALRHTFPAGTLSGAPKIRAMEIIDELETARRNVYGGAVCAIDINGNLNSCIIIRTSVFADGIASVRAGAGIVADSDPQCEADETRHKARSVIEAIALAEGGLA
ncbi:MAG: anthranilate synthase component I family protein [Proteobacteria bacterium]|nr:anthranilate synthase component I family protein [Pseudomonadota bacterium]